MPDFIDWLEKWQSLAAGLLGILAAVVGGTFISLQTAEARRQERERQRRRHAAARAVMPLALSATCDYAKNTAHVLLRIQARANEAGIPTATDYPTFPDIPSGEIEQFAAIIESANPQTAAAVAQLLRDLQIHNSRLRSLSADLASDTSIITTHNIDSNIVDALELYARAGAFFDYARGKCDTISEDHLDVARVMNALNVLGIHSPSESVLRSINYRAEQRTQHASPKPASAWFQKLSLSGRAKN